jgi:excisionase family DNA binding protein
MTFVTPAVYTIAEACAVARIRRSSLYKHIQTGDLRAIKIGGRTCILIEELHRWLNSMPSSTSAKHSEQSAVGQPVHTTGDQKTTNGF